MNTFFLLICFLSIKTQMLEGIGKKVKLSVLDNAAKNTFKSISDYISSQGGEIKIDKKLNGLASKIAVKIAKTGIIRKPKIESNEKKIFARIDYLTSQNSEGSFSGKQSCFDNFSKKKYEKSYDLAETCFDLEDINKFKEFGYGRKDDSQKNVFVVYLYGFDKEANELDQSNNEEVEETESENEINIKNDDSLNSEEKNNKNNTEQTKESHKNNVGVDDLDQKNLSLKKNLANKTDKKVENKLSEKNMILNSKTNLTKEIKLNEKSTIKTQSNSNIRPKTKDVEIKINKIDKILSKNETKVDLIEAQIKKNTSFINENKKTQYKVDNVQKPSKINKENFNIYIENFLSQPKIKLNHDFFQDPSLMLKAKKKAIEFSQKDFITAELPEFILNKNMGKMAAIYSELSDIEILKNNKKRPKGLFRCTDNFDEQDKQKIHVYGQDKLCIQLNTNSKAKNYYGYAYEFSKNGRLLAVLLYTII